MRQSRRAEQHLAFLLHAAYEPGLRSESSVVRYSKMTGYTHLASQNTVFSDFRRSGDARLGRHDGIFPYFHIMRYLAQIVYLGSFSDDCRAYLRLVDRSIGSYFHVILYDYFAGMLDFPVSPVF